MNNWLDAEIHVQLHAHIFLVGNVALKKKKKRNSLNVRKALAKSKENLVYKCIAEKRLWNPTEGVF